MDAQAFDAVLAQLKDFYQAREAEYTSHSLAEFFVSRADMLVRNYDRNAGYQAEAESLLDMAVCMIWAIWNLETAQSGRHG